MSDVFKAFVEPSLERIPILEISHLERLQGDDYRVTHVIQRNVFTEFDQKLSRHLAATRRAGFPAFTAAVRVSQQGSDGPPRDLTSAHYDSVPHALKGIADRAIASAGVADLTVNANNPGAGERGLGVRRNVNTDDLEALSAGLEVCTALGEPEFLSISGDYDIVIAGPPGDAYPITMFLTNGNVSMPCFNGTSITPFECPIHGFSTHVAKNALAQGYMAHARHALIAAKEAAVLEFRALAEDRIESFDRALAGRPLEGARLDVASGLIARLMAGLGSGLNGLSEDAQLTALDWSAAIKSEDQGTAVASFVNFTAAKEAAG